MNLEPWTCCRLCLSSENLRPIFAKPGNVDKYANVVFTTIGMKVEPSDCLPQTMCTVCITYINEIWKFRRKCEESYKILTSRLSEKQFCDMKIETEMAFQYDDKDSIMIDISDHLTNSDDQFQDYDDDVPLDSLKGTFNFVEKTETDTDQQEIGLENEENIIVNSKSRKRSLNPKETKRKRARKDDQVERKDRTVKDKSKGDKEKIECEHCHKILTSKLSMRNHYKIHTGFDVVCEHCGKKFITKRLLLMHCRAKHGYEKTDKCSFCDYRASNAEQVKIHERLHTGERPYRCASCGAAFHRKSSYLQHVAIHLPDKTVQCDQCPARFKSVTLMRIHRSRHRAPQYAFKCRVCDNSFARRRNVVRHLQRIHGLPPEEEHIDRLKIG